LVFEIILAASTLLAGIALLAYSSDKAVKNSVSIALALGISPLMSGFLIVSLDMAVSEKLYLRSTERKNTHREGDLKRG